MQEKQGLLAILLLNWQTFLVLATQNPIEQEGTYSSGSTGRSFYVENGYWPPKMDEERMVVRQNLKEAMRR
jgi:MoxR-like ATPase